MSQTGTDKRALSMVRRRLGHLRFRLWRMQVKLRRSKVAETFDLSGTLRASPRMINYSVPRVFGKIKARGKVLKGDWDKDRVDFEQLPVYKAFVDRYVRHRGWQGTQYYEECLQRIEAGEPLWGCKSRQDFDQRMAGVDHLFEKIRVGGYKSQAELLAGQSGASVWTSEDEVTVQVGSDGQLLFEDGMHRLCIAKLLDVPEIPVKVSVRHYDWYRFKKEVMDHVSRNGGGLYQKPTHPDLQELAFCHGDAIFKAIEADIPLSSGDVLDIGANWGYYCHQLEEMGFDCWAVESSRYDSYFLRKLRDAADRRFTVVEGSIFDFREKTEFDIVLALNVFHHFLKTRETCDQLEALLKRLRMKVMYFVPHLPEESQMEGAYKNLSPDDFVEFVLQRTGKARAEVIGYEEAGRSIYRLC